MAVTKTRKKLAKKPFVDIIHHENISHHFRLMIYRDSTFHNTKKHTCPLCRQILKHEEEVFVIINNYKAFPNVLVHSKCCNKHGKQNTVKILTKDYETALFYRFWFR